MSINSLRAENLSLIRATWLVELEKYWDEVGVPKTL